MHGFVEGGREQGAEVTTGGEPGDGPGAFYPPTVLAKVDSGMTVAQEEIFGPVVTVIPFEDERDAARIANDVRYGLFASVWTRDPARGHRLARQIKAGMIGINMPYTAFPGIPFGGYKQSGFGRELGIETLELYLETKSVLHSTSPKRLQPVRAVAGGRRHTPPPRIRGGYVVRSVSLVGGLFLFVVRDRRCCSSRTSGCRRGTCSTRASSSTRRSRSVRRTSSSGSLVLFVAWALGQPPGIGTVANAVLIGDLHRAPARRARRSTISTGSRSAVRIALLPIRARCSSASARAFYIGAAMGAGPRDSLMLVLSRRTGGAHRHRAGGDRDQRARRRHRARRHVRGRHVAFAILIGPIIEMSFGLLARTPLAVPATDGPRIVEGG